MVKQVLDASYLMKQELSKYNIDTLVEDRWYYRVYESK